MTNIDRILESPYLQHYYTLPKQFKDPVSFSELIKLLSNVKENMIIAMFPIDSPPQLLMYYNNQCLEYVAYLEEGYLEKYYASVEIGDYSLTAKYKVLGHWTGEIN